jgi:prephenate dehydratase
MTRKMIAFQGEAGANSHMACHEHFPEMEAMPCPSFEDAFGAVTSGAAALAMIPIENSVAGRVADIHHLLPESELFIIGERFLRVRHQLMAPKGASMETIKAVRSHVMALGQCRSLIRQHGFKPEVAADTAGAAREVSEAGDTSVAAIASTLAAEIYGLEILKADVEDAAHNTTRFVVMSPDHIIPGQGKGKVITSFVFRVRNVPAALYKVMGGFATNGVNMTKLESYQVEGSFNATQFYADIEGHPEDRMVKLAMEEMQFFSTHLHILGTYPADPFREEM